MIELDTHLKRRFGAGNYPESLFDFFNWGAFALPEIWGIVHGVWVLVWISLASFLIPVFILSALLAGEAISPNQYYGLAAFAQVAQGAARLWVGMYANRLYWQSLNVEKDAPILRIRRREVTVKQYLAKQRQWALVGMLVMIIASIMGVFWTFSVIGEMATPQEALFSAGQDILWLGAFLVGAYYLASKATILMAPGRGFAYTAGAEGATFDGEAFEHRRVIAPLNEPGPTSLFGAGEQAEALWRAHNRTPATPQTDHDHTATALVYTYPLANGTPLPVLGFGTYRIEEELEAVSAITLALEAGYRSIDTASMYGNESAIGRAIESFGIARDEVFITSKVWNDQQGYVGTVQAFEETLAKLGTDYLDMYLVHWPVEKHLRATWRALEHLYSAGRIRAIGVCNFQIEHLTQLLEHAHIAPMVNQIELHPRFTREELVLFCWNHGILVQSWAPLIRGGVSVIPELTLIAQAHNKTEAQVALRWAIQHNFAVIPKSTTPARIIENAQIFDFSLTPEEIARIDGLNRDLRIGPEPNEFSWGLS